LDIDIDKLSTFKDKYVPIYHRENWLNIKGSNATGHLYFSKVNFYFMDKFIPIQDIFQSIPTNIDSLLIKVDNHYLKATYWLDSLYALKQISNPFFLALKKEFRVAFYWETVGECLKRTNSPKFTNPSKKKAYQDLISKIYRNYPVSQESMGQGMHDTGYLIDYVLEDRKRFYGKVDLYNESIEDEDFHDVAPEKWRKFLRGNGIYANLIAQPEKYDYEEIVTKFKSQYPDSEWIPHLERVLALRRKPKEQPKDNAIHFIDSLQKSQNLQQLFQNELKGKKLYVDFWATWCAPCKAEFRYYNEIHAQLEKLGIQSLFISIDDTKDKEKWKKVINATNLAGYHTLASEKLQDDILAKIFDNKTISIPMYLLVDEQGNIIVKDAPRPSGGSMLIAEIKKAFNIKE
nr:TlpA family protein disulfide reductase [Thermoflexibacter sp.]